MVDIDADARQSRLAIRDREDKATFVHIENSKGHMSEYHGAFETKNSDGSSRLVTVLGGSRIMKRSLARIIQCCTRWMLSESTSSELVSRSADC